MQSTSAPLFTTPASSLLRSNVWAQLLRPVAQAHALKGLRTLHTGNASDEAFTLVHTQLPRGLGHCGTQLQLLVVCHPQLQYMATAYARVALCGNHLCIPLADLDLETWQDAHPAQRMAMGQHLVHQLDGVARQLSRLAATPLPAAQLHAQVQHLLARHGEPVLQHFTGLHRMLASECQRAANQLGANHLTLLVMGLALGKLFDIPTVERECPITGRLFRLGQGAWQHCLALLHQHSSLAQPMLYGLVA